MLSFDQAAAPLSKLPRSASSSSISSMRNFKPSLRHKHLFIVTGPAGCGKTTVAKYLSNISGFEYLEGDDVSPFAENDFGNFY